MLSDGILLKYSPTRWAKVLRMCLKVKTNCWTCRANRLFDFYIKLIIYWHVHSGKVFRNRTFYAFKQSRLSEPIISEMYKLWSLFLFENAPILMYTPNSYIWSSSCNFLLLETKYTWLGVNVLNLFKGTLMQIRKSPPMFVFK